MKALTARVSVLRAQMMATSAHVPLPIQRWRGGCAGWARAGRVSGNQESAVAGARRPAVCSSRRCTTLRLVEQPALAAAPPRTLRPLSTQPPSTRRAVVASAAASLPLEGSVRAQHPTFLREQGPGGGEGGGAAVERQWAGCGTQGRRHGRLLGCPAAGALVAMRGALHAAARQPPPSHALASTHLNPAPCTRQHPPEPRHVAQQLPLLRLAAQQAHCRQDASGGGGQAGRGQAGGSALGWRRGTWARLRRSAPPSSTPLRPCRCSDGGAGSRPCQRRAPRSRRPAPHP